MVKQEVARLKAQAKDNRKTDAWQWVAILGFALVFSAYMLIVVGGVVRSQAETIQKLTEKVK